MYTAYKNVNNIWVSTQENPLNLDIDDKHKALIIGQVQSGKTKFMIEQSEKALNGNFDAVIILGGTNNNLLKQTVNRFFEWFGKNFHFIEIKNTTFTSVPSGKSLITSVKGGSSFAKLEKFLQNTNDKKILIFDDESDFGSINTSNSEKRSSFNKSINNLYKFMDRGILVSVTATPFADILSEDSNQIKYSLILEPNDEYTGSDYFEKSDIYEIIDIPKGSKMLDENDILSMLIDHVERVSTSGWKSSQILFNSSLGNTYHARDYSNVTSVLNKLLKMPINEIMSVDNVEYTHKILKELSENVIVMDDSEINNQENFDEDKHSIVIGGALVSRGFTFKSLFTTVMVNEPFGKQAADTLLQRARWFGYRNELSKFMKVIVTRSIRESMTDCSRLLKYIQESLERKGLNETREKMKKLKFDHIELTGKK